MRLRLWLQAFAAALSSSSCTYIVVDDSLHETPPCAKAGDCAAGFSCVEGACAEVPDDEAPAPAGTLVDAGGGAVDGVDGVTLTFPAHSLTAAENIVIERASLTNIPVGFVEKSAYWQVSPEANVIAGTAATIAVPTPDDCSSSCAIFEKPETAGDPWIALDAADVGAGAVGGVLTTLGGVYTVGEVAP